MPSPIHFTEITSGGSIEANHSEVGSNWLGNVPGTSVVLFSWYGRTDTTPTEPTISGYSATWTKVRWATYSSGATNYASGLWWAYVAADQVDQSVIATYSGTYDASGFSTLGSLNLDTTAPIVQSSISTGSSTSPSTTLSAFSDNDNIAFGWLRGAGGPTFTPGTGFRKPLFGDAEFSSAPDTTVDGTFASSVDWQAIGAELKASDRVVPFVFTEKDSALTTTSATYSTVLDQTISGYQLRPNTKYLIHARAMIGVSDTTDKGYIRLNTADDSVFTTMSTDVTEYQKTTSTGLRGWEFTHSYITPATPSDLDLEFKVDGGETMTVQNPTMVAINLDELGFASKNYNSTTLTGSIVGGTGSSAEQGQGFKVRATHDITDFAAEMYRWGTPTDTYKVEIAASIDGAAIATSDNLLASTVATTAVWVKFKFSTTVELTAGTQYYARISRNGSYDESNYLRWYGANVTYADGSMWTKNSGTWSESSGASFNFHATSGAFYEHIHARTGTDYANTTVMMIEEELLGADPYVTFAYARAGVSAAGQIISYRVSGTESGLSTSARADDDTEDTSEFRTFGSVSNWEQIANSGHFYIVMSRVSRGVADEGAYGIALKASFFADYESGGTDGYQIAVSSGENVMETISAYTPAVDGQHLIFGNACGHYNNISDAQKLHIEDGTTDLRSGDSGSTQQQYWDVLDRSMLHTFQRVFVNSQKTFNLVVTAPAAEYVAYPRFVLLNMNRPVGTVEVTKTHTVDAILEGVITKTHTVDANIVDVVTKTHTVDAVLVVSAIEVTKTHTVDAVLQVTEILVTTVDAILQATFVKDHTVDAGLISTEILTHTLDASLQATFTKDHTTDAILFAVVTVEHTVDAGLVDTVTVDHTVDAHIISVVTTDTTVDAILLAETTKTHTVDAYIVDVVAVTHDVDATLLAEQTTTYTIDAGIVGVVTKDHTVDAVLLAESVIDHTLDAYIISVVTVDHSLDAVLRAETTVDTTVDAVLLATVTTDHSTDAVLQDVVTINSTVDAILQAETTVDTTVDAHIISVVTVDHSVDAILLTEETVNTTVDAILLATATVDHTLDSTLQAVETIATTVDALLKATFTEDHTVDARLVAQETTIHTVDASLQATLTVDTAVDAVIGASAIVHTLDAILQTTEVVDTTVDALLQATFTVDTSTDAILQTTEIVDTTIDAILLAEEIVDTTIDAILQATEIVGHTTDAILQATETVDHSLDALLQATFTVDHAVDAHIVAQETVVHTVDSNLQATLTIDTTVDAVVGGASAAHTVDAILQATETVDSTLDAVLQAEATISTTVDALLQVTFATDHTADAILQAEQTVDTTIDALLQATLAVDHTLDAILVATFTVDTTVDAVLQSVNTKNTTVDALLQAEQTVEHVVDAHLVAVETAVHDVDAVLQATDIRIHSIDGTIVSVVTATHTVDALLQAITIEAHTVDAVLFALQRIVPESDITSTGWDTAPVASQALWMQIDEQPASDTDYIFPVVT